MNSSSWPFPARVESALMACDACSRERNSGWTPKVVLMCWRRVLCSYPALRAMAQIAASCFEVRRYLLGAGGDSTIGGAEGVAGTGGGGAGIGRGNRASCTGACEIGSLAGRLSSSSVPS